MNSDYHSSVYACGLVGMQPPYYPISPPFPQDHSSNLIGSWSSLSLLDLLITLQVQSLPHDNFRSNYIQQPFHTLNNRNPNTSYIPLPIPALSQYSLMPLCNFSYGSVTSLYSYNIQRQTSYPPTYSASSRPYSKPYLLFLFPSSNRTNQTY